MVVYAIVERYLDFIVKFVLFLPDLVTRPVLIIGPLADAVLEKLVADYPHKFARCEPKFTNWSQEVS